MSSSTSAGGGCSARSVATSGSPDVNPTTRWPFMVSRDRKSTRLNSSHSQISYAVFCLKKKNAKPDSRSAAVISSTDHEQITPRYWFTAWPSQSAYLVLDRNAPNITYLLCTYGTLAGCH